MAGRTRTRREPAASRTGGSARRVARPSPPRAERTAELRAEPIDLAGHPGLLIRPPAARALYVMAHGAGAGMRHALLADVAAALAARAVATLRWEFPYMAAGKRVPDRAPVAEAAVREVWAAAAARFGDLARFAGGQSFGGRMTSQAHAGAPLAGACGLIFLAFPLHPPDKPGDKAGDKARIERAAHLASAAGPMLFVQGDRDDFAPPARLRPVVAGLGARATLHLVTSADHGFHVQVRSERTRRDVLDEIADTVARWITVHTPRR
jgi:predicted alpha/beta-hydrolase family hydrolase